MARLSLLVILALISVSLEMVPIEPRKVHNSQCNDASRLPPSIFWLVVTWLCAGVILQVLNRLSRFGLIDAPIL